MTPGITAVIAAHAARVIQVHCGVELDAAYRVLLTETVKVSEQTARTMIGHLGSYRKDEQ